MGRISMYFKRKRNRRATPDTRGGELSEVTRTFQGEGIYLLEFDNGVKIGMTRGINTRIKAYTSPWCKPILRATYFRTSNSASIEAQIINKFKDFALGHSPEYFYDSRESMYDKILTFIKSGELHNPKVVEKKTFVFTPKIEPYDPEKYRGLAQAKKLGLV